MHLNTQNVNFSEPMFWAFTVLWFYWVIRRLFFSLLGWAGPCAAGVMKNNNVLYTESADWSIPCAVCCIFSLTYELRICLVLCWVLLIWSNYLTVFFPFFNLVWQPVFKVTFVSCVLDQFYVVQQLAWSSVKLQFGFWSKSCIVLFFFLYIFASLGK